MPRATTTTRFATAFWIALLAAPATRAQAPAAPPAGEGRQWALLIGVEQYTKARPLVCILNDVKTLGTTLAERNGVSFDRMLALNDRPASPDWTPTRKHLLEEIPAWLANIGPDDRLLVYFSGHGFRDAAGKLYLAPLDVDPANPAATGIPVEWFREQIAACKAGFKLLVLDACHAGTDTGDGPGRDVPSRDIGEQFRNLERVVTVASSSADESSQIWEEKNNSLFTYWLNQALKGHADSDGDGAGDIDELYKYVNRNVVRTAKANFPRKQTPGRASLARRSSCGSSPAT